MATTESSITRSPTQPRNGQNSPTHRILHPGPCGVSLRMDPTPKKRAWGRTLGQSLVSRTQSREVTGDWH